MRDFFNAVSGLFKRHPDDVDDMGRSRLQCAVLKNDLKKVNALLKAGAKVDFRAGLVSPPLHLAVEEGFDQIVTALLKGGADVNLLNSNGRAPLHLAAARNREDIILTLLRYNANPNIKNATGETPLHLFLKNPAIFKVLLDRGADLSIRNNKGVSPYMKLLEEEILSACPDMAVFLFNWKEKNGLPERGANGDNILHVLARMEDAVFLARTLEMFPSFIHEKNKKNLDPLGALLSHTRIFLPERKDAFMETARLLLKFKANPDSTDEAGRGLLHAGVVCGDADFVADVLKRGANPNLADCGGKTALHLAIERKNLQVMDVLLDLGADPDMTDKRGWTILDRLSEKGDRDSPVVQRLIVAGGQYQKQLPLHPELMRHRKRPVDKPKFPGHTP